MFNLRSAPFPGSGHPDVAVHVPPGFRLDNRPGLLVFFHGHNNCVANVCTACTPTCAPTQNCGNSSNGCGSCGTCTVPGEGCISNTCKSCQTPACGDVPCELGCVRDAARNALGASATGFFSSNRAELEVRNVRYSCTPAPVYTGTFEDGVLHLQVVTADRAALTRCACRHDQFLQVTGVPVGAYTVQVEEIPAGDGGAATVLATGRIEATPDSPAA